MVKVNPRIIYIRDDYREFVEENGDFRILRGLKTLGDNS